jgi:hypothetical protein
MAEKRKVLEWKPLQEIDLEPDDPRNRFIAQAEGGEAYTPGPVTDEEKLEAAQLWDQITQGKASPGRKVPTSKK